MSLSFTMILVNNSMITVIAILFILSIIEILISIKLYKLIISGNEIRSEDKIDENMNNILKSFINLCKKD